MIHPIANADEVETFLSQMGWGNFADDLLEISHVHKGRRISSVLNYEKANHHFQINLYLISYLDVQL